MEVTPLYEGLDVGRSEIRVLRIFPSAKEDETLKLQLHTISLRDDPKYSALSYVWGNPAVTEDVILNGQSVPIGANLASALRHLRTYAVSPEVEYRGERPIEPFFLWADALCINQNDIPERNSQVKLMASIYRSAALVVSWLGPGNEQITRAFRTIIKTYELMLYSLAGFTDLEWMRGYPQLWKVERGSLLSDFWEGIETFNHLPYWRRVWIIQEMAFAKKLFFMIADSGDCLLTWEHLGNLGNFSDFLKRGILTRPQWFPSDLWNAMSTPRPHEWKTVRLVRRFKEALKDVEEQGKPLPKITDLLSFEGTLFHRATDPRDKIFALLNLMELDITADYDESVTVRDVYSQFGEKYLAAMQASELLTFSGIGWNLNSPYNLPSWVTDLQGISAAEGGTSVLFEHRFGVFKANQGLADAAWRVESNYILHTYGVVGPSVTDVQPPKDQTEEMIVPGDLFKICSETIPYLLSSADGDMSPTLGVLFRTFLLGIDPRVTKGALYTNITETEDLARLFLLSVLQLPTMESQSFPRVQQLGFALEAESFSLKEFYWRQFFPDVQDPNILKYIQEKPILDVIDDSLTITLWHAMSEHLKKKCRFRTENRMFGLGPPQMRFGDVVCVLNHCYFPVVLRKVDSHYVYIGGCYIYGLMDGEAAHMVKDGIRVFQGIEIW